MSELVIAIYARVSSDQQAEAGTIESQIGVLQERLEQDGLVVAEELTFVDEGYSGASLIRPGLERLRDVVAMQGIDRLYVCDPDRLARKFPKLTISGSPIVILPYARLPESSIQSPSSPIGRALAMDVFVPWAMSSPCGGAR